jgi:hypothetical protein
MAGISGASTNNAATSAADPVIDPAYSVNDPVGYPAQEIYPGALNPSVHTDAGYAAPGGVGDTIETGVSTFGEVLPSSPEGGGYWDSSFLTGHDGPQEAWDSSSGEPFAPSGAVNPELHGEDTGAVRQFEYVTPAEIGTLTRRTSYGQTFNRIAPTLETIGQTAPNDRTDMDQYQVHNPDGHDPWDIPYSERPIYNNVAYEAEGINPTGSPYTPSGYLPDRSAFDYAAQAYEEPPDPSMGIPATPATTDTGIGEGWV